jgi:hypothetical protein
VTHRDLSANANLPAYLGGRRRLTQRRPDTHVTSFWHTGRAACRAGPQNTGRQVPSGLDRTGRHLWPDSKLTKWITLASSAY